MSKAQWRDKQAILRDLAAVTQGQVAVSINEAITADRPPAPNFNEEIDEEHFRHCSGDATFTEGPDLHMIQEMISMMQSVDGETNEEARSIALEITKVTPPTPQTKSSTNSLASSEIRISPAKVEELSSELTTKITSKPKNIKARRERNVAIASLLKVHAGVAPKGYVTPKESRTQAKSPVKLLKPEDFAVTVNRATKQLNQSAKEFYESTMELNELTEQFCEYNKQLKQCGEHETTANLKQPNSQLNPSAKDVNPSAQHLNQATKLLNQPPTQLNLPALQLDQQTNIEKVDQWLKEGVQSSRIEPLLSADSFKFKKSPKRPANPEKSKSIKAPGPSTKQQSGYGKYVPSPYAEELYNKMVQKKETAQKIREDVWARAEREMKELDAKRAREARIEEEISSVVETLKEEEAAKLPVAVCLDDGVEIQIPAELCLPQYRHKLTGDCTVCETVTTFEERKTRASNINTTDQTETESPEVVKEISELRLGDKDVISTLKDDATDLLQQGKTAIRTADNVQISDVEIQKETVEKVEGKAEKASEVAMKLTGTYDVPDFWEELLDAPDL